MFDCAHYWFGNFDFGLWVGDIVAKERKFVYVVTEEGEYDKCFATLQKAQKYCDELDDIYDTGSWNIIKVPIKDFISPIY